MISCILWFLSRLTSSYNPYCMNPLLLKTAKFLAQRPTDRTIRLFHIISGLIIMQLLWYAASRSILDIPFMADLSAEQEVYVHIGLMVLGFLLVLK